MPMPRRWQVLVVMHADVARLRDEAQAALGRMQHDEPDRVQADLVGDHAHAVGAHEGDAALAGDAGDLPLGLGAAFARLGEAGGDGDGRLDALLRPHCSSMGAIWCPPTARRARSGASGSSSMLV